MSTSFLVDEEFGKVFVRRLKIARRVTIRVGSDGNLHASLPLRAPLHLVNQLLTNSRPEISRLLQKTGGRPILYDGMRIGKSHTLVVRQGKPKVALTGLQIVVQGDTPSPLSDSSIEPEIRETIAKALRIEAKAYLPRRLAGLAKQGNFTYDKVRYSHASSRWGSASTSGTISLNIALMKLPFEVIDYVLVHELCHTREMNHSTDFWELVSEFDPDYKAHRKFLKGENPSVYTHS